MYDHLTNMAEIDVEDQKWILSVHIFINYSLTYLEYFNQYEMST
jgi:hypothetical protein